MPVKIAGSEELCGLRIKTASQTNDQTAGTNVQSEQTDAIKMVRACVMDESQHTDQKCTSSREKIKRTTEEKIDGLIGLY